MKTIRENQANTGAIRQQFLVHCLPILGTGLLFLWISDGGLPLSWHLFVQACLHVDILWKEQELAMLLPFFVLVVQSLLILFAWGFVLKLALREGHKLFALLSGSDVEHDTAVASANVLSVEQQPVLKQQEDLSASSAEALQRHVIPSPSHQPISLEKELRNPFENAFPPLPGIDIALDQSLIKEEEPIVIAAQENVPDEEGDPVAEGNFPSLLRELGFVLQHEEDGDEPAVKQQPDEKSAQISQQEGNNRLENPFEEGTTPNTDSIHLAIDPFDVKQEVLDIFAATRQTVPPPRKRKQPDTIDKPLTELIHVDESVSEEFVYGHPFDGPLPDVYEHDQDLKRFIMTQLEEERQAQMEKVKQTGEEKPPVENKKKGRRPSRKKSL